MELQKQVCSLELANRLKQLAVQQDSYFDWRVDLAEIVNREHSLSRYPQHRDLYASAFTVAELGGILPYEINRSERGQDRTLVLTIKHPCILSYKEKRNFRETPECKAPTEADARAKMLIYLLENKLLQATEGGIVSGTETQAN